MVEIVVPVLVCGVVAGVLGALGPRVIAALPEPPPDGSPVGDDEALPDADSDSDTGLDSGSGPDSGKPLYSDIALAPRLALWLGLASAVLAGAVATTVRPALLPAWIAFCVVGVWLSYVDARTRLLPFALTVPLHAVSLALVGLGALLAGDWHLAVRAILANVAVFVVFWLVWLLGRRFGGGAFGYGDVRLAAIAGLVLGAVGVREAVIGTYAAFILAAVCGIVLSLARLVDPKAYAFGPYVVLGAVVGAVLPAVL